MQRENGSPPENSSLDDKPARRKATRQDYEEEQLVGAFELEDDCEADTDIDQSTSQTSLQDFSYLKLKVDHNNRPLWVCPDGTVYLETYSPIYKQAYDFLIAVAEPVCRPSDVHEYRLTEHSLYAAASIGVETSSIIAVLGRLSKVELSAEVCRFIEESTRNYGKVKLVLDRARFFVESPHPEILQRLMADATIRDAMVRPPGAALLRGRRLEDRAAADLALTGIEKKEEDGEEDGGEDWAWGAAAGGQCLDTDMPGEEEMEAAFGPSWEGRQADCRSMPVGLLAAATGVGLGCSGEPAEEPSEQVYSFEIKAESVDRVKERCLPSGLNYPMLEEYDFKNDEKNLDVPNFELKPTVSHRPYQEKSLAKMFGNSRARSGIIVLPCGAGKTLVGISAAQRIGKSCLCLATNSVSVDQWHAEFKRWTTLEDHQVSRFTAQIREDIPSSGQFDVCITTYNMVSYSGRRSEQSKQIMDAITNQEWGLILMDEVHVVPAQMFRKVVSIIKSHCKLGLTATLVREDALINDLNFLIGPKLYEANWLDLAKDGHIANVQSNEVWCPMSKEFFREYLKPDNVPRRQMLYCLNPNKFQACQFLIEYHERQRGDKIIVFSDNLFALREYATRLKRPFICGATSHGDRTRILYNFKHNPQVNTIFLSKVGDNSIDVPEANVLLQISSHAGSRRQEAQRLGRILRAKRPRPGAEPEEHNAFFYSLVSQDTQEMYFSAKRQQFLVAQGYSFQVVSNLLDAAGAAGLQLTSRDEQLNLLAKILSLGVEEELVEEGAAEVEATPAYTAPFPPARRAVASLSAFSGADGRYYMEYTAPPPHRAS